MSVNKHTINKYRKFLGDNEFVDEFLGIKPTTISKKHNRHEAQSESKTESEMDDVFVFQKSPQYITHQLRDYQIEGVNWLINMHELQINAILADEMGLGKTLQSITLLGYVKFIKKEKSKNLIIVPKSTLQNWKNEFTKYMPNYDARIFHCSSVDLKKEAKFLHEKFDGCITTYEMCLKAKKYLQSVKWHYLIIDEAHRIKNENSILSLIVRILNCKHRLLLTGTPLQNNIRELWALLNFIIPEIFSDAEKFENFVVESGENETSIEKLRNVLQSFFLRREKNDVEKSLLPKKTINLYTKLSDMQKNWYKMILQKDLTPLLGLRERHTALLNVVMQLKKCCNHPYLFPEAEPGPPYTTDEHIVFNCGKMQLLDKLLQKLKAQGSRVLLFSQMSRMLDIIEDYCEFREFNFCRIDGSTSSEDRIESIEEFNKPGSEIFIFLLTTRAGGLGINLATADTVIIYDTDWNPQVDLQAQDRAHRIGQKKQVYVYRFITENTIEEKIILRSLQKLKLDEILLHKKDKATNDLNQAELLDILATGVDKIDSNCHLPDNIEDIIRFGEERTREFQSKLDKINFSDLTTQQIRAYEFEGEDFSTRKLMESIPMPKRKKRHLLSAKRPEFHSFPFYQFYPTELYEIQKIEHEHYQNQTNVPKDLIIKKEKLLLEGFDWTKKDFQLFIKGMCSFGRDSLQEIATFLDKNLEEVKKYHSTFWARNKEVPDNKKIILQVEKAEANKLKNTLLKKVYAELKESNNFVLSLALNTRSKLYPEYVDKFLIETYLKYCDNEDSAQAIYLEVHRSPIFMYNYFIVTRSANDLMRRINTLINGLLRENKKG